MICDQVNVVAGRGQYAAAGEIKRLIR